jgi:uncharacterized membrane protein
MSKIDTVKKEVHELKKNLLIQEPAHFSRRDLIDSFFGALLLGLTFAVKGLLIEVSSAVDRTHIVMIVFFTFLILTAEIYFIGYKRVRKKSERKFGQFWLKRILAFYCVALVVSVLLIYLYGLYKLPQVTANGRGIINLVVIISFPCAIGAAIADLLKKY